MTTTPSRIRAVYLSGNERVWHNDAVILHRNAWRDLKVGERFQVRPKRVPVGRTRVTVAEVLDKHYANGFGFIGDDGATYWQWYYDLELRVSPA